MRSQSTSVRIAALIVGLSAAIPATALVDALVRSLTAPPARYPVPPMSNVAGTELFGFERAMAHARRDYPTEPEPLTGLGTPFGIPTPPDRELQELRDQQDAPSDRPAATSPPSNRPPSLKRRPKMAAEL